MINRAIGACSSEMKEHRQAVDLRIEDQLAGVTLAFMINPGSLPFAA